MRGPIRVAAALALLLAGGRAPTIAQDTKGAPAAAPALASYEGSWTASADGDCSRALYDWTVSGDRIAFRDAAGREDVERVVERRADGFTAVTVSSPTNRPGTRWDYHILGPDLLQVRNLLTGRSFRVTRCGPPGAPHPEGDWPGGWGFFPPNGPRGGARLYYGERGDNHGALWLLCDPDGRRLELNVASGPLPAGRRVRVTLAAGSTTTALDAVAYEGPVAMVGANLPSGHPLVAMLRGGGTLRASSPGGEVAASIPLAGAAGPAGRFAAACRPR